MPNKKHPSSIARSDYGTGSYRRKILIETTTGLVSAMLEDDPHGFRLQLFHDGKVATDIKVEAIRYPYDTCSSAADKIEPLIGLPLVQLENLSSVAKAREHCTHQFDLLQLALDHWRETGTCYEYSINIPDEVDGEQSGSISCNGEQVHHWDVANNLITAPESLRDRPLRRGFYAWVAEEIHPSQRRAAEMLQRGFIVSTSRTVDMELFADQPVIVDVMPTGACYSLQLGTVEHARRNKGVTRDFTNNEEMLLKFQ